MIVIVPRALFVSFTPRGLSAKNISCAKATPFKRNKKVCGDENADWTEMLNIVFPTCERFALTEPENYKRFTVPHILEINTTSFDHTWYFGSSYSPSRSELHQAYYALLFPSWLFAYHANQTLTTDTRYCAKKKTSQIWKSLHVFTDAQENFLRRICSTMFPTRPDKNCS